jgi:predicted N-acetyltransferase YhbS
MNLSINSSTSSPLYRCQLNDLLQEIFDFSLELWFSSWGWPDDYISYSLVEDGKMLANVSIYRMDLLLNGVHAEWFQVGAVATRVNRRGEGLSRRLLEKVLADYPDKNFVLCANASVLEFYPRFGFRRIPSWLPNLEVSQLSARLGSQPEKAVKISLEEPRVKAYLNQRSCVSSLVDCINAAPIHWFHLLMEYADCIYEIPQFSTLLAARQEGSILDLAGVWARQPVSFLDLAPALAFPGVNTIRFGFQSDWLQMEYTLEERDNDGLFVRGDWPAGRQLTLPELLRT